MSVNFIAKNLSWNIYYNIAYGKCDGIFANITYTAFTGTLVFTVNELKQDTFQAIMSFLEQNKKSLLIRGNARYDIPYLSIDFDSHYAPLTKTRLLDAFRRICTFLKSQNIVSRCDECGIEGKQYAMDSRGVHLLCDECHRRAEQKENQAQPTQNMGKSYWTGLVGSLAGGVVSILPWMFFAWINFISFACGIFTAAFCITGYKKFKGKIKKPMIAILLVVIVVFTLLGVIAWWYVDLMQEGYTDFTEIMTEIFSDLTLSGITADAFIALLFAGFGAAAYLSSILRKDRRQNTSKRNKKARQKAQ